MKSSVIVVAALSLGLMPIGLRAQAPATDTPAAAASPADFSQYTTADALWQHLQEMQRGPKTMPKTEQEYRTVVIGMLTEMDAGAVEFIKRYPTDPRKWDAQLLQVKIKSTLGHLTGKSDDAGQKAALQGIASAKDAPATAVEKARMELVSMDVSALARGDKSITGDTIVQEIHQFATDFPAHANLATEKYRMAMAIKAAAPDASTALLKEVAASGDAHPAQLAQTQLGLADKLKSPLDLHFTAVDGTAVDFSKMRGKVILVDFWATWCGPCKGEVPHVVETYKKLHDKGFEVVGISLDQDKDSLVKYTAAHEMTWPQYFDGKGWQNEIASGYGIQSIPAMWLINKKGYVATTNGREDLEGQVEKLLAE